MRKAFGFIAFAALLLLVTACSRNSPGPLEGKWRVDGVVPITVEFIRGESEAMGVIDEVTYRVDGDSVFVTYQTGMSRGSSMRFRVVDQNTLQSELGTLRRIQ